MEPLAETSSQPMAFLTLLSGGQGRNRTTDTRIFSPLLYLLSYLAVTLRRRSIRRASRCERQGMRAAARAA